MTSLRKTLTPFLFFTVVITQQLTGGPIHFSDHVQGRLAFVVEDAQLPWSGSFDYLSSLGARTALLTVADSSTGIPLGECSTNSFGDRWEHFSWTLTSNDLVCTVSQGNSSRIRFTPSPSHSPRSFSVRIQGSRGPRCMSSVEVNGVRPSGCPPQLSREGFSQLSLQCGCPYINEEATVAVPSVQPHQPQIVAQPNGGFLPPRPSPPFNAFPNGIAPTVNGPPTFPLVQMSSGVEERENVFNPKEFKFIPPTVRPTMAPSTLHPCINHLCANGGRCFLNDAAFAECECVNGFSGRHCERDICAQVPCGNGGRCTANGSIAMCHCPPNTRGLLCEEIICDPICANGGSCILKGDQSMCDCPEGFTGPNCNVIDPCVGDAACAVYGNDARCLIDESVIVAPQIRLVNATFDCKCPQKNDPEWIDCILLHTSTVAPTVPFSTTLLTVTSPPRGPITAPSPFVHSTSQTVLGPLMPVPGPMETIDQGSFSNGGQSVMETTTTHQFTFHQVGGSLTPQEGQTSDQMALIPNREIKITLPPRIEEDTTLIPMTSSPSSTVMTEPLPPSNQHAVVAPRPTVAFPTPGTMPIDELGAFPTEENGETTPSLFVEGVTEGTDEDPFETQSKMTVAPFTQSTIETTSEESTTIEETTLPSTTPIDTTTQETIQTQSIVQQTTTELAPPFIDRSEEVDENGESEEKEEMFPVLPSSSPSPSMSTRPSLVLNRPPPIGDEKKEERLNGSNASTDRQANATASWIVALVAIVVLALILLATAAVVMRYIRQSRKLHGKYNPAREEHALSTAYAMPMNAVAKEERLI